MTEPGLAPSPAQSAAATSGSDRVLMVLATIARHGRPVAARELVELTGLPQSTLYRQVAMLKRWGFVLESAGTYAPGPISLQLALGFDHASHLVQEARIGMAKLVAESGESVGLVVAVKDQAVCLEMVESQQSLRCSFEKGRGVPLLAGASAKSLLAFMPPAAARTILADLLAIDADTQAQLQAELTDIRAAGYALSEGEVDPGVWGVSVPVFRLPGHALGSITLMAPATRVRGKEQRLIDMTVAAAASISARLQDI
ncbi:IclR family transcriptional regulator [Burkholderiaceae bacterium 26]|nr:IclR family transcriptional regulator [Burkholderiaceae bacterium 26]